MERRAGWWLAAGPVRRTVAGSLATSLLALGLTGCFGGSSAPTTGPGGTALPSPVQRPDPPGRVLDERVRALLGARSVAVDEDLQTGDAEQEVRLTWAGHGSVVDASSLPIGSSTRTGTEVFRSPDALLQRSAGEGTACWSPGGRAAARYARPTTTEVDVLRSARETSGTGALLRGSVSAHALLGLLGSDAELRTRGLDAPAGARVDATFGTTAGELQVTVRWRDLLGANGSASKATGTWLLDYRPLDAAGPSAPTADMMCP